MAEKAAGDRPDEDEYLEVVGYSRVWAMGGGVGRLSAALIVADAAAVETAVATIALGGAVIAPAGLADVISAVATRQGIRTTISHHHRHPVVGPCPVCDQIRPS